MFLEGRGSQDAVKINKKTIKKVIDDKMEVGMDVGRLLDRFWIDFGPILGGKLAPSWHQNQKNEGSKRTPKSMRKTWAASGRNGTRLGGGEPFSPPD